jgi:hypothetical protein
MVVAALMVLLFGLDLALNFPFGGTNRWAMDLPMIICASGLGYLSWATFREQV